MTERFEDSFRDAVDGQITWAPCTGTIRSFDSGSKTASVIPELKLEGEAASVIDDVPIIMPTVSGWSISWKPLPGDKILLIPCMTGIGKWLRGKDGAEAAHTSLSNVIGIAGLTKSGGKDTDGILISNDTETVSLEMTSTGIEIKGDLKITGTVSATQNIKAGVVIVGGVVTPATGIGVMTHQHPSPGYLVPPINPDPAP